MQLLQLTPLMCWAPWWKLHDSLGSSSCGCDTHSTSIFLLISSRGKGGVSVLYYGRLVIVYCYCCWTSPPHPCLVLLLLWLLELELASYETTFPSIAVSSRWIIPRQTDSRSSSSSSSSSSSTISSSSVCVCVYFLVFLRDWLSRHGTQIRQHRTLHLFFFVPKLRSPTPMAKDSILPPKVEEI